MKPKNDLSINELRKSGSVHGIKIINQADIDCTLTAAKKLPRKREPILIHETFEEVPQRFVNCLNQDSYVRPHMHVVPNQWELMCWLSGEIIAIIFDEYGAVISKIIMNESNARIIEIPPFCYHTFIAINVGSYLEVRNCKYQPSLDRLYSTWSPPECTAEAIHYHKRFFSAEVGESIII